MHDIAEFLGGRDPFSGLDEADAGAAREPDRGRVLPRRHHDLPAGRAPPGPHPGGPPRSGRAGGPRARRSTCSARARCSAIPRCSPDCRPASRSRASEDTLCYSLAAEDVIPLLGPPSSLRFLARSLLGRRRPRMSMASTPPSAEVAQQPAPALVRRPPGDLQARDDRCARRPSGWTPRRRSSVLVEARRRELGIVTDSDLRSRVVAGGLSADDPVSAAMTTPVVGVGADQTGADVMLAMLDHDVRHVPVVLAALRGARRDRRDRPGRRRDALAVRPAPSDRQGEDKARAAATQPVACNSTVVALHRAELAPVPDQRGDLGGRGCTDPADDRARDRVGGTATGRVLLDVAGQPRQARAGALLGRRLGHGLEGRARSGSAHIRSAAPAGLEPDRRYMRAIASSVSRLHQGASAGGSIPTASPRSRASPPARSRTGRQRSRRWLTHPERQQGLDRDLDPARRPHRLRAHERAGRQAPTLRVAATARPWSAGCCGWRSPRSHPRASCATSSSRHRASSGGPSTSSTAGCCRLSTWRATRPSRADATATPRSSGCAPRAKQGVFDQTTARMLEEAFELFSALRLEHQVRPARAGRRAGRPPRSGTARPTHPPLPPRCVPGGRGRAALAGSGAASHGARRGTDRLRGAALLSGDRAARRDARRGARPTFSVIDLETTGLDPASDEIISFATVTVSGGKVRFGRRRSTS